MPAAAVTLAAASWLTLRARVMAAWVGWFGFVVSGAIAVTTAFLIGPYMLPLLFLWVTAASVELWRTRGVRLRDRTETPPVGIRVSSTGAG